MKIKTSKAGRPWVPVSLGLAALCVVIVALTTPGEAGADAGKALFAANCAACHTMGADRLVGPGLGGLLERREPDWILRKIMEPDRLASSKDPVSVQLAAEYGMSMPNLGIARTQAESILGYFAEASGTKLGDRSPASRAPADPPLMSSDAPAIMTEAAPPVAPTAAQVRLGQELFQGTTRLANGGVSCIACHHVSHDGVSRGGNLAVDLTGARSRLSGSAIQSILESSPFPAMRAAYAEKPLTKVEIAALGALLGNVSAEPRPAYAYAAMFFGGGVIGALLLIGFFSLLWRGRRRESVNQSIYDRQMKSS